MRIATKYIDTHWITCKDDEGLEYKLYIDYPTFEQQEALEELFYSSWTNIQDRNLDIAKYLKYERYYLKYTIKDWQNVMSEDGKEIKMILTDNEMDLEQWQMLTRDAVLVTKLFDIISPELTFNEADKKKLNLSAD